MVQCFHAYFVACCHHTDHTEHAGFLDDLLRVSNQRRGYPKNRAYRHSCLLLWCALNGPISRYASWAGVVWCCAIDAYDRTNLDDSDSDDGWALICALKINAGHQLLSPALVVCDDGLDHDHHSADSLISDEWHHTSYRWLQAWAVLTVALCWYLLFTAALLWHDRLPVRTLNNCVTTRVYLARVCFRCGYPSVQAEVHCGGDIGCNSDHILQLGDFDWERQDAGGGAEEAERWACDGIGVKIDPLWRGCMIIELSSN